MFVDQTTIKVIAGKGGNGIVSWRREKYIPKGGPYGGNGGRGGSILFKADHGLYSLETYRNKRLLKAEDGQPGGSNLKQGRSGEHLVLKVPFGTLVKNAATGEVLYDFTTDAPPFTACTGGPGGRGNASFKTPTNRTPNICTPGRVGDELEIELQLKLIADVGLVGMPNAGKSTLLSSITHAKVKIGNYPFTTLSPNLSYVECDDFTRILIADIPGIIEGASENKGLGLSFLKHIERTSVLAFVLDIFPDEGMRDPLEDFMILRSELGTFSQELLDKPFIVILSKIDKEGSAEAVNSFRSRFPYDPNQIFQISAQESLGFPTLIERLRTLIAQNKTASEYATAY